MRKYNVNVNLSVNMDFEVKAISKKRAKEMVKEIIEKTNILELEMPNLSQRSLIFQVNKKNKKVKCAKKLIA